MLNEDSNITTTWVKVDAEAYQSILAKHKKRLSVFETITDTQGVHGAPRLLTVWGYTGTDTPVIKADSNKIWEYEEWEHEYYKAVNLKD